MKARANKLGANVNRAVRKLALVVDRELVLATPVDTGRARSNWIVSLGAPETGVREPYKPHPEGSKGGGSGTSESGNAAEAMAQGAGVIAKRRLGQSIHIVNNVPYIGKLDAGHSKQAPANFVKKSIMNGIEVLRATKVIE